MRFRDQRDPAARAPRPWRVLAAAAVLGGTLCAGLHTARAQGGDIERGKQVYASHKCAICHSIAGKGGRVGPALDDAGKNSAADRMLAFLTQPTSINKRSAMSPTRGTPEELRDLTAYMMSLGGVPRLVAQEPSIGWGQQLFASKHCFYCHQVGKKGGRLGPALDNQEVVKKSREFLAQHFKNPSTAALTSMMPLINVSEPEQQSLMYFVESLKPGGAAPSIVLPSPSVVSGPATEAEGEALYHAAACYNCHAIGGVGTHVGPALDDFGMSGRKKEWLIEHFRSPDQAAPGTPMPIVQGTNRQIESLSLYLFSLKTPVQPNAARGKSVYEQQNCGYCHGNDAKGRKAGPSLLDVKIPRTDAWILQHLRDPAGVTPNSAMPRIWGSDWELQSLLEHLKSIRGK